MAITSIEKFVEGAIMAIAEDRGVDGYFNELFVRDHLDSRTSEEAWVTLRPYKKLWLISDVFKKLSKTKYLTPGQRRKGSIFYAKRGETVPKNVSEIQNRAKT